MFCEDQDSLKEGSTEMNNLKAVGQEWSIAEAFVFRRMNKA